jgi:hypothetical protein
MIFFSVMFFFSALYDFFFCHVFKKKECRGGVGEYALARATTGKEVGKYFSFLFKIKLHQNH